MIFDKEFLVDKFSEKVDNDLYQIYPYDTLDKPGEVSSGRNMVSTYHQYFDLRSEEAKDRMFNARKEITNECFKEENLGIYPNQGKIDECIRRIEVKHFGKYLDNRNLYFGNGIIKSINFSLFEYERLNEKLSF